MIYAKAQSAAWSGEEEEGRLLTRWSFLVGQLRRRSRIAPHLTARSTPYRTGKGPRNSSSATS
jgi:hypothetical protein